MSVLDREREHRAVGAGVEVRRLLIELRSEYLLEGSCRRSRVAPPRARVEAGRVDDVRVQRIEPEVGDAKRDPRRDTRTG